MRVNREVAILEAVLFSAGNPIAISELANIIGKSEDIIAQLIKAYESELEGRNSGVILRETALGYQLVTKPELYDYVDKMGQVVKAKLSSAVMETLAIIAYKQPITKLEIEEIRGVKADKSLAKLLEYEFIAEIGRKDTVGRPIIYGTTEEFLVAFGLKSLAYLPEIPELPLEDI